MAMLYTRCKTNANALVQMRDADDYKNYVVREVGTRMGHYVADTFRDHIKSEVDDVTLEIIHQLDLWVGTKEELEEYVESRIKEANYDH